MADDAIDQLCRRFGLDVEVAYSLPGLGRFRCNVFHQRGTVGLARMTSQPACYHCGLPADARGRYALVREEHTLTFCCPGCLAVATDVCHFAGLVRLGELPMRA